MDRILFQVIGTLQTQVSQWLKQRLNSALHSQQPLQTSVELVQSARDGPNGPNGPNRRSDRWRVFRVGQAAVDRSVERVRFRRM